MTSEEKSKLLSADALSNKALGISVSESPDLGRLGLMEDHFRLALGEIARTVLVSGGKIFYGGHLQPNGYTTFLMQELQKYGRRNQPLKICLSWSEHRKMSPEEIQVKRQELGLLGEILLLDQEGQRLPDSYEPEAPELNWDSEIINKSLAGLREFLVRHTHGRILLGGKRYGFQGAMPGLIEEAVISIQCQKPLFLAGGYGGATLSIISSLCPANAEWFPMEYAATDDDTKVADALEVLKDVAQNSNWQLEGNGLDFDENRLLAATYRPSEIAALVGMGLGRMQ